MLRDTDMVVDILAVVRRVRHQVVAAAVRIRSRLRETVTAMDTVSAAVRHQIVRRIVHQKVKDISPLVATAAHLEEATITTVVTNPVAEAAAIVPETPAVTGQVAEAIMEVEAVVIAPVIPAVTNQVAEAITVVEAAAIAPAILVETSQVAETIPVAAADIVPAVTNPVVETILVAAAAIVPAVPAVTNPVAEAIPVAAAAIVPAALAVTNPADIIPVAEVAIVPVVPVMDLVAVLVDILVAAIALAVPVMVPVMVPVTVPVTVPDIPATLLHARCVPTTRTTIITRARLGRITTIRLTSSYTTSSEWL